MSAPTANYTPDNGDVVIDVIIIIIDASLRAYRLRYARNILYNV